MIDSCNQQAIPVFHMKEYTLWSMDEITNDDLKNVTQSFGGKIDEHKERNSLSFQLNDESGEAYSTYGIVPMTNIGFSPEELRFFNMEYGVPPKICITFDHPWEEASAELSINFIKALQKQFPNLVFDPYDDIDEVIIGDDIQKIVFTNG